MSRTKAIVFDFDFTLGDASRGIHDCINNGLTNLGFDPVSYEESNGSIGKSLPDTFVHFVGEEHRGKSDDFYRFFMKKAMDVMVEKCVMYPQVPGLLEHLTRRGFMLGVASTKHRHRINEILSKNNLTHYFSGIVGGEDVTYHKPNPECLEKIMQKLGVSSDECIYVGDNIVDAKAANTAGVGFIGVLTGVGSLDRFDAYDCLTVYPDIGDLVKYFS
jgi:phosphoglycolate phosphatase